MIALVGVVMVSFQNCGEGFKIDPKLATVTNSSNSGGGNNPPAGTATPVPFKTIPYQTYVMCRTNTAGDDNRLATCLTTNGGVATTYNNVFTCTSGGNSGEADMAFCLSKQGIIIADHRAAMQSDFDACNTAVGATKIATCLEKRGIKNALTQADIDACVAVVTVTGIEKCLRSKGKLARKATLMSADLKYCAKVAGSNAGIASCLINWDLAPATLTQSAVDTCIGNVGVDSAVKCLRNNFHISKVVMQSHINACADANAGATTAIATCLDNNGLAPFVAPMASDDLTRLQTQINTCVTNVGLGSVAKCLRTNGFLSTVLMKPHVMSCAAGVGSASAAACLDANGLLPNGVNQAVIDECVAAATVDGVARCLRLTKKVITDVPTQPGIFACVRFGGTAPDPTKPGQVGIAACLNASGLLMAGMTQANFDTCIANTGGVTGIEACLYNIGAIGSFARLNADNGPFNQTGSGSINDPRCQNCHNNNNMNGNMNILSHSSVLAKLVPGDPANSKIYQRMTGDPTPMPPSGKLGDALIERVRIWILQGARNN